MKKILSILLLCLAAPLFGQQKVVVTTPYTDKLLKSTTAQAARSTLGLTEGSVGTFAVAVTPWAETGTLSSNSIPWPVFSTVVATNGTNCQYPSLCYDFARRRLLGIGMESDSHYGTNSHPRFFESYDGGKTWKAGRSMESVTGNNVPHFGISALQDGTLLGAFFNRTYPGGVPTEQPIRIIQSTDGGQTWTTNSTIGSGNMRMGSQAPFEVSEGVWLFPAYPSTGIQPAELFRSTDRGQTWSCVLTNNENDSSESAVGIHPNGVAFWITRAEIYTSTNFGLNWDLIGALNPPNYYASYPSYLFLGNRLMLAGRSLPYGSSTFWYNDDYPYTNAASWHQLYRRGNLSIYDYGVKLSESVSIWLSSVYAWTDDRLPTITIDGTNAWMESWIMANDAQGWSQQPDYDSITQPAVWLKNNDIPSTGRMTTWPNWGTLQRSPTNDSTHGPLSVYLPKAQRAAWCMATTNSVGFGTNDVLPGLWQTNTVTAIWRAGRTNAGQYCFVFDCCQINPANIGLSVYQYGSSVHAEQMTGGAEAGTYTIGGMSTDYSGLPHVYAMRLSENQMRLWSDGSTTSYLIATNTGSKLCSTSGTSTYAVGIGIGNGTGGIPIYMTDIMIFTNALSDAEIYAWSAKMRNP